jgi:hypothetical protein
MAVADMHPVDIYKIYKEHFPEFAKNVMHFYGLGINRIVIVFIDCSEITFSLTTPGQWSISSRGIMGEVESQNSFENHLKNLMIKQRRE